MAAPSSMQLIRGLPAVADRPVALTVGNFDGVHRGHQAMLARLAEAAEDLSLTRRLASAGTLLGIEVLDHVVLGAGRWSSLKERGHL